MSKKKNRLQEVKDREKQKKRLFETIAKTKSYHTPVEHYKNKGKGIDLSLLAESGFKFAEEDKDFLHKTKEELDKENKEIKKLNESFLGIGGHSILGNPFKKNLNELTATQKELKTFMEQHLKSKYPISVKFQGENGSTKFFDISRDVLKEWMRSIGIK